MDSIISKIDSMRENGKLTTEQSVEFILQLLFDLHEGQQGIMKVLVEREDEIKDLNERSSTLESRMSKVEVKVTALEGAMLTLSENLKESNRLLNKLDQEVVETSDLAHETKRQTDYYWMTNHKTLSMFVLGGVILLINLHEEVYKFILALLNIRLP